MPGLKQQEMNNIHILHLGKSQRESTGTKSALMSGKNKTQIQLTVGGGGMQRKHKQLSLTVGFKKSFMNPEPFDLNLKGQECFDKDNMGVSSFQTESKQQQTQK